MVSRLGKQTNWMDDAIGQKIIDYQQTQWGEIDGQVVSFDATKQIAEVKPLYKPTFNGKAIDMPNLYDVPVRFVRAGSAAVTYPIKVGDKVTLRPKMRSSEKYHAENDGQASDARFYSLADMEAYLDGGESLTDPIKNFDSDNMHVRFDDDGKFGIRGSKDGKVKIEGSQGNIYDLLAQVVELLSTDLLQINYGSSAGSGHQLQHKAKYAEIAAKLRAMAL